MRVRFSTTGLLVSVMVLAAGCGRGPEGLLWEHRTPRPWLARDSAMRTPVLAGEVVLVCDGYSTEGKAELLALDASEGRRLWSHGIGSCHSAPLVEGGVVVGVGSQYGKPGTVIKAVEIATGRLLWSLEVPRVLRQNPILHRRRLHFYNEKDFLRVAVADGRAEEWNPPECSGMEKRSRWVAADGERLLAGCRDAIYAVGDEGAAKLLARLPRGLEWVEEVAVHGDAVYVVEYGRGWEKKRPDVASAFSLQDGRERWRHEWKVTHGRPLIANGSLYLHIAHEGFWGLVALDPATGQERWRTKLRGFEAPTPAERWLYAVDHDGIVLLEPGSGAVLRRVESRAEIVGRPAVAGAHLIFGDIEGAVYAIARPVAGAEQSSR